MQFDMKFPARRGARLDTNPILTYDVHVGPAGLEPASDFGHYIVGQTQSSKTIIKFKYYYLNLRLMLMQI